MHQADKIEGLSTVQAIEDVFKSIDNSRDFAGRDRIPLNSIQKHHLAHLFNVLGYSHDKWLCHLATPANRTRLIVQGDVYVSPPL